MKLLAPRSEYADTSLPYPSENGLARGNNDIVKSYGTGSPVDTDFILIFALKD
jgi:hypothetical protein